jgi:hypothetical protein
MGMVLKLFRKIGVVDCNSSYLGGKNRRITSSRPAQAK